MLGTSILPTQENTTDKRRIKMIKRITFSPLTATGISYIALGGLRFYNSDRMFDIGTVISSNSTRLETTELIATVENSYNTTTYALLAMLDNNLKQNGDYGTYWLSSRTSNNTLSITFKNYQFFDKLEFITRPSTSTDRGVNEPFTVSFYTGEDGGALISETSVNPSTTPYEIQKVRIDAMPSSFTNGKANDKPKSFRVKTIKSNLKMTSNTAPSPYVAKASTEYSTSYQAFKAFNGEYSSSSSWISQNGVKTGWLQIDYGSKKLVNSFTLTSRNSSQDSAPRSFRIVGSDDETNWTTLKEVRNQHSWGVNESRFFYFNKVAYFRFYRLIVLEDVEFTYSYVAIGGLDYSFDETGITELPDREEKTLENYSGALSSIGEPISSYNYILNNRTVEKAGDNWTKTIKNKPLYISVNEGEQRTWQ